jgi:hypothetical protein
MRRAFVFAFALLLLTVVPAGEAFAVSLYDRTLTEKELRATIDPAPVAVVLYHVGKDLSRLQLIERLLYDLRDETGPEVPFFRVDVGPFLGSARSAVVRDIGKSEFPAIVVYHYGSPVQGVSRPPEYQFDKLVEQFKPFFKAPPIPDWMTPDPARGEEPDVTGVQDTATPASEPAPAVSPAPGLPFLLPADASAEPAPAASSSSDFPVRPSADPVPESAP